MVSQNEYTRNMAVLSNVPQTTAAIPGYRTVAGNIASSDAKETAAVVSSRTNLDSAAADLGLDRQSMRAAKSQNAISTALSLGGTYLTYADHQREMQAQAELNRQAREQELQYRLIINALLRYSGEVAGLYGNMPTYQGVNPPAPTDPVQVGHPNTLVGPIVGPAYTPTAAVPKPAAIPQ